MTNQPTEGAYHPPAPGKSCGACSLCCKAPPVASLGKPAGQWCQHIVPGAGCGIYEERPHECRVFHCHWMTNPDLSAEWKPEVCGFVIFHRHDGNMWIAADPRNPDAWKAPRYYGPIKSFAGQLLAKKNMLTVHIGLKVIVVLPAGEVDMGIVPATHRIAVGMKLENGKPLYQARLHEVEGRG